MEVLKSKKDVFIDFNEIFSLRKYPAGEPHIIFNEARFNELDFYNSYVKHPRFIIETHLEFKTDSGYTVPKRDFNGLALIAQANESFKSYLGSLNTNQSHVFAIPYMPFGRHDRRENPHDALPINLVRKILEDVPVITVDPHSDVTGNEFSFVPQANFVKAAYNYLINPESQVPIIPDNGATKKVYEWAGSFSSAPVQCSKRRDPATGALSGFSIDPQADVNGKNCVIFDDICDGGGTFLGILSLLKDGGAKTVTLAVTHGLFTKGLDNGLEQFDSIICLDRPGLIRVSGYDKVNIETIKLKSIW